MSKNAMDDLAAGMKSKDPTVRAAAEGIYETVKATLALSDSKLWAQRFWIAAFNWSRIPGLVACSSGSIEAIMWLSR